MRSSRLSGLFRLLTALLFLLPLAGSAADLTLPTESLRPAPTVPDALGPDVAPDRYFVRFAGGITAEDLAAVQALGIRVHKQFPEIGALALETRDPRRLAALTLDPRVAYVEQEPMRYPLDLTKAQLVPEVVNGLYGLVMTGATAVHARGITGAGIAVGVADTSIDYNHPDIKPNYRGGIDIVGRDNDPINDDRETHGTHVAATILAANDTQGVLGVAYGADLYHARVLGPRGGTSSDVMAGVRWLVESGRCRVVNLSLGGGRRSQAEESFYEEMRQKGVLVVCAAGNEGRERLSFPAAYPPNVAVGAVDRNGARASFSNRGPEIDVVAPGVAVLSAVPVGRGLESSVQSASTYTAGGLTFSGRTDGVTATLIDCGSGRPEQFSTAVAGNIALIRRGETTFADKVTHAMNVDAVAAIIYNDVPGDFAGTLGAARTSDGRPWIPALSVADTVGAALQAQVGSIVTVLNKTSHWAVFSGTSMATPHVAGVIALIWSANPEMASAAVEHYLRMSCTDLGETGFDPEFGSGLVNADAAVAMLGR